MIDPISGAAQAIGFGQNFDPTIQAHVAIFYPGSQAAAIGSYSARTQGVIGSPLPRTWNAQEEFIADVTNLTYSLSAAYVV